MTSLAEACPNIVMESISNECISISNDVRPMPDFYRENAIYYSNDDNGSLLKALDKRMHLSLEQENILRKNLCIMAQSYSWDSCFRKTDKELKIALKV